jgi:hypothetical protein
VSSTIMLKNALALAQRGLAVFPCLPGTKVPATPRGFQDATTDVAIITAWWSESTNRNLAIATGVASGIFVVDVDGSPGELALDGLESEFGKYAATIEAITPRPGRHIYFRLPAGITVNCSTGKIARHLDVRGTGGYVVAPPSRYHGTDYSGAYRWSIDCAHRLADPPQWLLDKITAGNGNGRATPTSEWRDLVTNGVVEGQRNVAVARVAGYLLRRYLDATIVRELMQCWNTTRCRPPLASAEIDHIVTSIADREQKKREASNAR